MQLISTFVGVFTSFCINNQEQGNELKGTDNKTFVEKNKKKTQGNVKKNSGKWV